MTPSKIDRLRSENERLRTALKDIELITHDHEARLRAIKALYDAGHDRWTEQNARTTKAALADRTGDAST